MLYKIVLIDDEEWILSGLENAIEWEKIGFQVIGAYTNGKDALEAIEKSLPDAILSDIKMPILDGISLISKLRDQGMDQIEVVFLTGYDEFELARSSLRLGVADYILKPCDQEELAGILEKMKLRLDKKQKSLNEKNVTQGMIDASVKVFKNTMYNMVVTGNEIAYKRLTKQYSEFLEQNKEKRLQIFSVVLSGALEGTIPKKEDVEAIQILETFLLGNENDRKKIDLLSNMFTFSFIFWDWEEKEAEQLINELRRKVRKNTGKILYSAKSDKCKGIYEIWESYRESLMRLYHLEECPEATYLLANIENDTILKAAIEDKDQQLIFWRVKKWMYEINDLPKNYRVLFFLHLLFVMSIFMLQSGIPEKAINNLYSCLQENSYEQIKERLVSVIKAEFISTNEGGNKNISLCHEVARYISKNYAEEITLNDLAKIFYMSPNYLGMLFKKNMGMGVKEYQANIRLEQAEVLIASGKFKLYQVAEMVGYSNYEYFRKVYYRYRGKNPSK